MATAADTFQRKEKKYLITASQCAAVKAELAKYMRLDDYGATRIDSLYLDDDDHSLICRSLEKPLYKEKLRIRSYGSFSEATTVFVELKKKFKGIVYKRRVRMSAEAAKAYCAGMPYEQALHAYPIDEKHLESGLSKGNIQIAREIDAFFDRHPGLRPAMLISCMREAWCPLPSIEDACVDRITFDENITAIDFSHPSAVQRQQVIAPDQVVMEIKCAGGYPVWLCTLLSSCDVYPRSFSKYGNAYKRSLVGLGEVSVHADEGNKIVVSRIPAVREKQDVLPYEDVLLG